MRAAMVTLLRRQSQSVLAPGCVPALERPALLFRNHYESMIDPHNALVVASISGGKDSAALSLYLHEQGIEHERVFADTGWESAETYAYLDELERAIGPITRVKGPRTMVELIRHKAMFPSRVRRFCTEQLKVRPLFGHFFERIEQTGKELVNAVGVRAAESASRAKMPEWDGYSDARGDFWIWRPIIHWTQQDVIDIHHRHNLRPNPLYLAGASRVGCWPCIFARKAEIRHVADSDPDRIDLLRELERETTEAADARAAAKGETNEHPRTFFAGRGPGAVGGRAGAMPIDEAVQWSRTAHGGRQLMLLDTRDPDEGCLRWGMCEHPTDDTESEP